MSKVIKTCEDRLLGHVVETNDGKFYYVDSANTSDCGYETMVFTATADGTVTSWLEVFVQWYYTYEAMAIHHNYLINNLEEVV